MFFICPPAYVGLFQTLVSVVCVEQAAATRANAAAPTHFELERKWLVNMRCSFAAKKGNPHALSLEARPMQPSRSWTRKYRAWPAEGTVGAEGKAAIVTGGNTEIGKAITLALAEERARLVIDLATHPNTTEELE